MVAIACLAIAIYHPAFYFPILSKNKKVKKSRSTADEKA